MDMPSDAIIAGAYFGDRYSPMSSSANLTDNKKEMLYHGKSLFKEGKLFRVQCMF